MADDEYYVTYRIGEDLSVEVAAKLHSENDRDGLLVSLDMYRTNLGPISWAVWKRFVSQFNGELLLSDTDPE